jgi:hypothetical protein
MEGRVTGYTHTYPLLSMSKGTNSVGTNNNYIFNKTVTYKKM